MAAMEREVEQVVGEERARFDKERSRLEKELRKVLLRRLRFLTAAPSTRHARRRDDRDPRAARRRRRAPKLLGNN